MTLVWSETNNGDFQSSLFSRIAVTSKFPMTSRGIPETESGLIFERVSNLKLDGMLLPFRGERNLSLLRNTAPAVGQFERGGLTGRAKHAEGEAVAAGVELFEMPL